MTYRGHTLPFGPLSRNAELGLEAPINSVACLAAGLRAHPELDVRPR
jgi:hypothetical protein